MKVTWAFLEICWCEVTVGKKCMKMSQIRQVVLCWIHTYIYTGTYKGRDRQRQTNRETVTDRGRDRQTDRRHSSIQIIIDVRCVHGLVMWIQGWQDDLLPWAGLMKVITLLPGQFWWGSMPLG